MKRKNVYLLISVVVALIGLVGTNYYTIKILSAVRAYINGESEYSKGQKDALLYLSTFLETGDTAYMKSFNEAIQVPMGDNLAREALLHNYSDDVITHYFRMGRNHPADIPGLIWLFRRFQSSYMKDPVRIWTEAQPLIDKLYDIGTTVNARHATNSLSEQDKQMAAKNISYLSAELYKKESEFSTVLGVEARQISGYLLYANIIFILLIVGNIAVFTIVMFRRLDASYKTLELNNEELIKTNRELDTLIYSVSHDLRSPINSIKGLTNLVMDETDPVQIKEYVALIRTAVETQDNFILEIIEFFKNKRQAPSFRKFSLNSVIEIILASNRFVPTAQQISFHKEIGLDEVYSDELRIKMIINNMVSNAIKYSDDRKLSKTIMIRTFRLQNSMVIEIEDNGIGMEQHHMNKIYDMFYVASNAGKGSGLGLYILKHNIEKLNGKVEVASELNSGSKFTVTIPFIE